MSWQALNWAVKQRVGHAHSKAVLVQLANYADEHGSCFPSQAHLAEIVEVSERTLGECVRRLEADGYLVSRRDRLDNGRLGMTRYTLCLDRPAGEPPEAASSGDHPQNEDQPPEADAPATGRCFRSDTPDNNHQQNPLREAQAREGQEAELRVPNGELLEELRAQHPQTAHDSPADSAAAWRALTPEQRRAAHARFGEWMAARGGRKALASLGTYLREKRWELLPPRPGDPGAAALPPIVPAWSRAWWGLWVATVERCGIALLDQRSPAALALRKQADLARMKIGWRLGSNEELQRAEAAAAGYLQVHRDSGEAAEWKRHYGDLGASMPLPDHTEWLWLPAKTPAEKEVA